MQVPTYKSQLCSTAATAILLLHIYMIIIQYYQFYH